MKYSYDQLFSTGYEEVKAIRARENLANEMPAGYGSMEELDRACLELMENGRLHIVDSPEIRQIMSEIKNQQISRAKFQELSLILISKLVSSTNDFLGLDRQIKVAISIRGGMPFYQSILDYFPGASFGFSEQQRDESTLIPSSQTSKLGEFSDKTVLAVDFMLATGGSLVQMLDMIAERGALRITTITAFSAPQGIINASRHEAVQTLFSLPLEAGLNYIDENHHGYIVGGQLPNSMLGDFGDRFHGSIN